MIDLSGGVTSLSTTQTLHVRRPGAGTFTDGRFASGAETVFDVLAVLYPGTGETTLLLPEAERTRATIVFFTIAELFPTSSSAQRLGDVVEHDGRDWEILVAEDWNQAGKFFKYIAARVGQ